VATGGRSLATGRLDGRAVVYGWPDGLDVKAGLEDSQAARLVLVGALTDGRTVVLAVEENDATAGNTVTLRFGAGITPLDLMLERQVNDLRMALYGIADQITIQNWYTGAAAQTEVIQAGTGEQLLNTQVEQLIQAMAGFSAQTGLTWEQAIAQRPEDVQAILAANWQ
jgi:hypothetical protein